MINFYDTNILLEFLDRIFDTPFVVSSKVLEEIENIKTSDNKSEDLKYKARKLSRSLDENKDKYLVEIVCQQHYQILEDFSLPINNDNIILASAWLWNKNKEPITFITNDINCKVIGQKVFNLQVESMNYDDEYLGYKEVVLNNDEIIDFYNNLKDNFFGCCVNEYLIIRDNDGKVHGKFKWNGKEYIRLGVSKIKKFKPLNIQQELAFDLMASDTPIKILLGCAGSGKTLINLKYGLSNVENGKFDKILYLKEPIGKGTQIGYLKGDKDEKISPFLSGLIDNLDLGEDELDRLVRNDQLEIDCPYFLKGASKKNTWIMVDEAEDLDVEMIKLIGTRLSSGSVICFSGDLNQTENKYKGNNGLRKVINEFKGNKLVGIVKLDTDERSEASKLFTSL